MRSLIYARQAFCLLLFIMSMAGLLSFQFFTATSSIGFLWCTYINHLSCVHAYIIPAAWGWILSPWLGYKVESGIGFPMVHVVHVLRVDSGVDTRWGIVDFGIGSHTPCSLFYIHSRVQWFSQLDRIHQQKDARLCSILIILSFSGFKLPQTESMRKGSKKVKKIQMYLQFSCCLEKDMF
jgi:hypothetical protein